MLWIYFIGMLANAASFDCSKANSPASKLICSDPELSKLDEVMAAAYKQCRSQYSKVPKEEVKKTQKIWLKSWGPSCTTNNKIDVKCARKAYKERINVLQNTKVKTINGMSVVEISVDYFRPYTKEDPPYEDIEYLGVTGSGLNVNYSVVNNPTDSLLISALNEWLLPSKDEFNTEHKGSDGSVGIELFEVSKHIVGRRYGMSDFVHGNPHPTYFEIHKYFLPIKGRPLIPSDIFIDPNWSSRIAEILFQKLKKEMQGDFDVSSVKGMEELIIKTDRWYPRKEGIQFNFDAYDVGPYTAGSQSALIPWTTVKQYMSPFAKAEFGVY